MLKLLFNLAVPRGRIKRPRECKPRQLDVSLSIQQDVLRLRGGGLDLRPTLAVWISNGRTNIE